MAVSILDRALMQMEKAFREFLVAGVRIGAAAAIEQLTIQYYNAEQTIGRIATVTCNSPSHLTIRLYDSSTQTAVLNALRMKGWIPRFDQSNTTEISVNFEDCDDEAIASLRKIAAELCRGKIRKAFDLANSELSQVLTGKELYEQQKKLELLWNKFEQLIDSDTNQNDDTSPSRVPRNSPPPKNDSSEALPLPMDEPEENRENNV